MNVTARFRAWQLIRELDELVDRARYSSDACSQAIMFMAKRPLVGPGIGPHVEQCYNEALDRVITGSLGDSVAMQYDLDTNETLPLQKAVNMANALVSAPLSEHVTRHGPLSFRLVTPLEAWHRRLAYRIVRRGGSWVS